MGAILKSSSLTLFSGFLTNLLDTDLKPLLVSLSRHTRYVEPSVISFYLLPQRPVSLVMQAWRQGSPVQSLHLGQGSPAQPLQLPWAGGVQQRGGLRPGDPAGTARPLFPRNIAREYVNTANPGGRKSYFKFRQDQRPPRISTQTTKYSKNRKKVN